MRNRIRVIVAAVIAAACVMGAFLASGREKKKEVLPDFVLEAKTVLVIVDPDVGISMADPTGNRKAQEDVEKALMNWGRLKPVMDQMAPDLIMVVRKGTGKAAQPTVGGVPPNDRPVILEPTDGGIRIGGQTGRSPSTIPGDPNSGRPTEGVEVGAAQDMLTVYRGDVGNPLESAPLWRNVSKDGLKSPSVPAVSEFKKAVDEAVKEQQQRQKQQPQPPSGKP